MNLGPKYRSSHKNQHAANHEGLRKPLHWEQFPVADHELTESIHLRILVPASPRLQWTFLPTATRDRIKSAASMHRVPESLSQLIAEH
jgi:hypothetical protein